MALTKTFEKSFRTWMEAQAPEIQAEAAEMLNRAKSGAITPKELSKYQEKYSPKAAAVETPVKKKPVSKAATKAEAPKADTKTPSPKVKSVANNPSAKATADAVKAETAAVAKPAAEATKTAGRGIGKALGKYVAPAYVGANVVGRGMEMYRDLGEGKTIGEALNKPESNKQVGEAALDTGLALAGMRAGARFGLPGAVIGAVGLPLAGKLGLRAADVAIRGPKKQNETVQPSAQKEAEAATPTRQYAYEEIESMAKQKGVPFEEAFRQIQQMQREEIDRRAPAEEIRRAEPTGEVFTPSALESAGLAQEAVRAPIGQEPDILSFLQQPDADQMLAELSVRQASRVQSASNVAAPDQKKKRETSPLKREEETTNPANDRPLPRFYVNTGRFGTIAGAGSRRPLG